MSEQKFVVAGTKYVLETIEGLKINFPLDLEHVELDIDPLAVKVSQDGVFLGYLPAQGRYCQTCFKVTKSLDFECCPQYNFHEKGFQGLYHFIKPKQSLDIKTYLYDIDKEKNLLKAKFLVLQCT